LNEKDELRAEVEQRGKYYESLEDKAVVDVSWAFLNTRLETLMEVSREGFDLDAEIAKTKEMIEKTLQSQSFSSPEVGIPEGDEIAPGEAVVQSSPAQVALPSGDDATLHPTGSDSAPK